MPTQVLRHHWHIESKHNNSYNSKIYAPFTSSQHQRRQNQETQHISIPTQPTPILPTSIQSTPIQPATTQATPVQPATVVTPSPAPSVVPVPAPSPIQRSLLQIAAPSSVTVGQQFSLDIKISDAKDLANAPFVLTYDPIFVEFVSISEGTLLKSDGKPTTFSGKSDAAAGTVNVTSLRATGNAGVNGGGTLATLLFKAKNKGPASFAFKNSMFTSSTGAALSILPFSTAVDIR